MKNLLFTIMVLIVFSCKAQSPIIQLGDYSTELVNNSYWKDVNNEINKFEGTWKYEEGNAEFIIALTKNEQYYNGSYFEDRIIGDYKYVENGILVADYLSRLTDSSVNDAQHYISGNFIVSKNHVPRCQECSSNERRFELFFTDPDRRYLSSEIILRYFIENGVEKIKVWLYDSDSAVLPYEGAPTEIRVPYGTYIMTKQ